MRCFFSFEMNLAVLKNFFGILNENILIFFDKCNERRLNSAILLNFVNCIQKEESEKKKHLF